MSAIRIAGSIVELRWVGANEAAQLAPEEPLEGRSSYFFGGDPGAWRTNVPHYGRVRARSLYPGIDVVYYAASGRLEFDLVVSPGADPAQARLRFEGVDAVRLSPEGDLILSTPDGGLRQLFPRIYQDTGEGRAEARGILVIYSAGNTGPRPGTLGGSGKHGDSSLAIGATENSRFLSATATVNGEAYLAKAGDGPPPAGPVEGQLEDVSRLDSNGQACAALPANSLQGLIAFIIRGGCNFVIKLDNVAAAGAIGALVYSDDRPVTPMAAEGATLPAMMVSNADGLKIKAQFPTGGRLPARLDFTLRPVQHAFNRSLKKCQDK